MLVLTRETEQTIVIDGPCVIRVLSVERNRVKLGFIASRSVQIIRGELVDREAPDAPHHRR